MYEKNAQEQYDPTCLKYKDLFLQISDGYNKYKKKKNLIPTLLEKLSTCIHKCDL